MDVSEVQDANAKAGMAVAPGGQAIAVIPLCRKAPTPTDVTASRPVIDVSEAQRANALVGMAVTPTGTSKLAAVHVQPEKPLPAQDDGHQLKGAHGGGGGDGGWDGGSAGKGGDGCDGACVP